MTDHRGFRAAVLYGVMLAAGLTSGALAALCALWFEGELLVIVYMTCLWFVWPAISAVVAFIAGKRGIPAILAWFVLPFGQAAAYFVITELAPPFGALMFSAFIGIIGASAGEVWRKRKVDHA